MRVVVTTGYLQHNHLGCYGNSLRVFVTDAGADQILTLDAPAGTDDYRFIRAGAVVSGNKGGKSIPLFSKVDT